MSDTKLITALEVYRQKIKNNPRIARMIKGWEPVLVLYANDKDISYYVKFENGLVSDIKQGKPKHVEHVIEIDGHYAELLNIFTGATNPAQSFLKGDIKVFSNEKDQVKLDAISLVLWGI